ncbi:MAG: DUF1015 domain-containing protein [Chloroflexi bacterium]|nr:DUF1015 domain-containing protein [Chloroflexota bacterium]
MAEVRPFRGIRFVPAVAGDIGGVICPPYDVIDPDMQRTLHARSPYNIVRVEYGLTRPGDSEADNRYTRAAACLGQWAAEGALRRDRLPAFYLHHHHFTYQDRPRTRRSVFAAVRIEEFDKGIVRPHEGTAAVFKADRLKLIRATHANTSPVLAMYCDPGGAVAAVMEEMESAPPLFNLASAEGESHTLWAMQDEGQQRRLSAVFDRQGIYIADGHHRYETGLAYRNERRAASPAAGDSAAFNFIMMSLVELSAPGVIVLPTHRLVRGLDDGSLASLRDRLARYFEVEPHRLDSPRANMLATALRAEDRRHVTLGVLGAGAGMLVLRLRDHRAVANLMPAERSEAYRKLDVSVLHHVILQHILGLSEGQNISYTRSDIEAWQRVAAGEFQLAFLLNPVDAHAIKAVAGAADKMPQKSTYFYPKAPTGLVLNCLDDEI